MRNNIYGLRVIHGVLLKTLVYVICYLVINTAYALVGVCGYEWLNGRR